MFVRPKWQLVAGVACALKRRARRFYDPLMKAARISLATYLYLISDLLS
jgi:hypothetical protein